MREYKSAEDVKGAVKAALKAKGLTVTALAEMVGDSQGNVSRMLGRINPSFNAIRDLVGAFGYKLVFDIVPVDGGESDGEEK